MDALLEHALADPTGPLSQRLTAALQQAPVPAGAAAAADRLPHRSIVFAELAAEIAIQATAHYGELAAARPDAFLPNLAMSLNNQSNRLAALGRREDALTAINEAVQIRRELAAARPDAFLPDLAMSLNNQSNRLAALGRREDALTTIEEANAHYRELADKHQIFISDLAQSLTWQGILLSTMGDHYAALSADREAVSLYMQLSPLHPSRFQDSLEQAVRHLVIDLRDLGHSQEEIDDEIARLSSQLEP